MDFEFSQEEQEIVREVRRFIAREATPALLEESHKLEYIYGGPEGRTFIRKFAAEGWLVPSWPAEYGGRDASEMVTYIILNELATAGLPFHCVGAHMVGPSILRFGSKEHKRQFLPPIASGEIEFALGYSEPGAGSDLMGLKMRAEDRGDHFLVNGQKTFNTHAKVADYHWLAVRTNPEAARHKGISILIVDLKTSGITVCPMVTMCDTSTNEVFYDDVIVPKANLVGQQNEGFRYIMAALDFERMFPFGHYRHFFDQLLAYVKSTGVNGKSLSKDPLVRQKLAQLEIEFDALDLLYFQLAHILDSGRIPNYQSSIEKNFFADVAQHVANVAMEISGLHGLVKSGDLRAPLSGEIDFINRWSIVESIYGGTSEIQRNIIAQRGLGMPRG